MKIKKFVFVSDFAYINLLLFLCINLFLLGNGYIIFASLIDFFATLLKNTQAFLHLNFYWRVPIFYRVFLLIKIPNQIQNKNFLDLFLKINQPIRIHKTTFKTIKMALHFFYSLFYFQIIYFMI